MREDQTLFILSHRVLFRACSVIFSQEIVSDGREVGFELCGFFEPQWARCGRGSSFRRDLIWVNWGPYALHYGILVVILELRSVIVDIKGG